MRLSVLEGCFAMLPGTFSTGVFLTGFGLLLGADLWAIGLLGAIPALGQAGQLLAAYWLPHLPDRKAITVWGATASRALWLVMAAIPFLPLPGPARLGLFLALLALSTVLGQLAGVAWMDWMADLVPDRTRGRYFGLRNAVTGVVGVLALWGGTRLLDAWRTGGQEAGGFVCLALIGALGTLASMAALAMQAEPPRAQAPGGAPSAGLRAPLANLRFRRLTGAMVAFMFLCGLTGPFCYPYALQHLNVGYNTLGTHAMIVSLLGIVSQPLWGRLVDRFGAQAVLTAVALPLALHPLYWAAMRPDFLAPLWVDAVSSGLFWPALHLATFALLLEAAPARDRAAYMGFFNCVTGLATSLAAILGGLLLSAIGARVLVVGGATLGAIQLVMITGAACRIVCALALRAVPRVAAAEITIDVRPGAVPEPLVPDAAAVEAV